MKYMLTWIGTMIILMFVPMGFGDQAQHNYFIVMLLVTVAVIGWGILDPKRKQKEPQSHQEAQDGSVKRG